MSVHDLFWSESKYRLFQFCPLAFHFHYYESWHGWKIETSELAEKLYEQKKQKSLEELIDEIFWNCLQQVIEELRRSTEGVSEKSLRYKLKQQFINYHLPFDEAHLNEMNKLYQHLIFLLNSSFFKSFLSLPESDCLALHKLDYFLLGNMKIWGVLPLVYMNHNQQLKVVYFRQESSHKLELKIPFVFDYLMHHYSVNFEQIEVYELKLWQSHPVLERREFDITNLMDYQELILDSFQQMETFEKEGKDQVCAGDQCMECRFYKNCPHALEMKAEDDELSPS